MKNERASHGGPLKPNGKKLLSACFGLFAVIFAVVSVNSAGASGPSSNRLLNYQIRLTDTSGYAVADGTKNIKLSFYTSATGGSPIHTDCGSVGTPAGRKAVFVGGVSSILIGDTAADSDHNCAAGGAPNVIPADLFTNASLYLGVTVEGDAEMTPRKRIVAAGYALNADRLDDLETSASGGDSAYVPVTDTAGLFTLTGQPTIEKAVITANPSSAPANALLIDLKNVTSKFTVDAEGDTTVAGSLQVSGVATLAGNVFLGDTTSDAVTVAGKLTLGSLASDPSGVNGMMYYSTSANKFRCYANGAWADCASAGALTGSGSAGQLAVWNGSSDLAAGASLYWDSVNARLGIGDATPAAALTVGSGDAFQVTSAGAVTAATGITSSGTVKFTGLTTAGVVHNAADGTLSTSLVSLTADVSGTLPVANGGTGATTFTTNGVLYGNAGSAVGVTAAGTSGQMLVANASGVPTFVTMSGDATLAYGGGITLKSVGTPSTYGSASAVPVITTDAQGRVTTVTNTSIAIAASQITSGVLSGANGGTGLNTSAATGVPLINGGTWSVNASLPATLGGTGQSTYAKGDLLAGNASNTLTKVAVGSDGYVLTADSTATGGVSWQQPTSAQIAAATKEPTGMTSRAETTISFDNASRTLTIAPTGSSFSYWIHGVKYTKTVAQTATITNTEGAWNFYFDGATLTASQSAPTGISGDYVTVASLYWDAANGAHLNLGDERHGIAMDWATHSYLHNTVGTRYASGFTTAAVGTVGNSSPVEADTQVTMGGGTVYDEDMELTATHSASPAAPFEQKLTNPAYLPVFYRSGASAWRKAAAQTYPYMVSGGAIQYNTFSSPNWTTASPTNNYFVAVWFFATDSQEEPVIAVMGQRQDASLAEAKANNSYDALSFGALPFKEMKALYRAVYLYKNTWSTSGKAALYDLTDFRNVSSMPGAAYTATAHSQLTGLDYATSGHTGFAMSGANTNITALSATTSIDGTGSLAVAGTNATALTLGRAAITTSVLGNLNVATLAASKAVFTDSSKNLTSVGTLGTDQGGTGLAAYTAGDMTYYASGSTFTKLAIGTSGYVMVSNGSAPTWSSELTDAQVSNTLTASKFVGTNSTTDAVDLATAEVSGTLPVANGGTGATTAVDAANNLLPSQSGNSGKFLTTNGSGTLSWAAGGVTEYDTLATVTARGATTAVASSFTGGLTASTLNVTGNATLAGGNTYFGLSGYGNLTNLVVGADSGVAYSKVATIGFERSLQSGSNAAEIQFYRSGGAFGGDLAFATATTAGGLNEVMRLTRFNQVVIPAFTTAGIVHNAANGTLSTSAVALASDVSGILPVANGGTGSSAKNFVDLTTAQTAAGTKIWSDAATFNSGLTVAAGKYVSTPEVRINGLDFLRVAPTGNGLFMGYNAVSSGGVLQTVVDGSTASMTFNSTGVHLTTLPTTVAGVNSVERLTVTNDGYVGIGTASPTSALHVVGNVLAAGNLKAVPKTGNDGVNGENVSIETFGQAPTGSYTPVGGLRFQWYGQNPSSIQVLRGAGGTDGSGLGFYTSPGTIASSEVMRLTYNGKATIGSTTATSMFNVGTAAQFQVNDTGAIAAATGITSSGTIKFSGLTTAGVVTNSAAGVLSTTAVLPVANGGTGATAFSSGSLVFATTAGTYAQDNANLYWDDANNRLGVGISIPHSNVEIYGNVAGGHVDSLVLSNAGATANSGTAIYMGYQSIGLGSYGARILQVGNPGLTTSSDLKFQIHDPAKMDNNDSSWLTPLMIQSATGNVGVGTTSPAAMLSVGASSQFQVSSAGAVTAPSVAATSLTSSTLNVSGNATLAGSSTYFGSSGLNHFTSLVIGGDYGEAYTKVASIGFERSYFTPGQNVAEIQFYRGGSTGGELGFATGAPGSITEVMRLREDNKVVINGFTTAGIVHNAANGVLSTSALALASDVSGVLPVTNGGTGATTAFTSGSLVFAGAGGAYAQDNANLYWDDANNRLGIGTTTPHSNVEINGNVAGGHVDSLVLANAATTAGSGTAIYMGNQTLGLGTYGARILQVGNPSATRSSDLMFQTHALATSGNADSDWVTPLMIQSVTGNVGVGTTSPSVKLHVAGNIKAVPMTGNDGTGEGVSVETFGQLPTGPYTPVGGIRFQWYDQNPSSIQVLRGAGSTDGSGLGFYTSPGTIASSEVMRLTYDGKVQINNLTTAGIVHNSAAGLLSTSALSLTADVTGTLPVANGGTGTSTAFTAGSLVFAGAGGVYAQDNANLYWDDVNNRLGVGTTVPVTDLQVGATGKTTASVLRIANSGGSYAATATSYFRSGSVEWLTGNSGISNDYVIASNPTSYSSADINTAARLRLTSNGLMTVTSMTSDATATGIAQTMTVTSTLGGAAFIGGDFNIINNQTISANRVFGLNVAVTDAGSLANIVTGLKVDVSTANANDTTYAAVFNGGNVGIGTSTPATKLEVLQTGGGSGNATALSLTAGNESSYFGNNQILMGFNGTLNYASAIKTRHNSWSAAGNAIDFYTWNFGVDTATTAGTKHVMTLDGTGSVGIGNTVPSALLTLGTAGTRAGTISMAGATSGVVTLQTAATAGTWTMTVPTSGGISGQVLSTNGSGVTSWISSLTNPMTTAGDMIYGGASGSATRLAGASGLLHNNGSGTLSWGAVALASSDVSGTLPVANGGTGTSTAFTAGSLVFATTAGTYAQDNANLYWDDANNRLGVGTTAPQSMLQLGALTYSDSYATNHGKLVLADGGLNGPEAAGGIEFVSYENTGRLGYGAKLYTNNQNDYFGIGTRADSHAWTERLSIKYATGNVGIGTTAPDSKLTVQTGTAFDGIFVKNGSGVLNAKIGTDADSTGNGYMRLYNNAGNAGVSFYSTTDSFVNVLGGNFGVGTNAPGYRLDVSNTSSAAVVRFTGSGGNCYGTPGGSMTWTCSSDARLKSNVSDYGSILPALLKVKIRDYTWIASGSRETGVIAQEYQQVLPSKVVQDADGYLRVTAPSAWELTRAIQEVVSSALMADQATGLIKITPTAVASAIMPASDSMGLAFRASVWDEAAGAAKDKTITVANRIGTDGLTRLGLANDAGEEIAYFGENGDLAVKGVLKFGTGASTASLYHDASETLVGNRLVTSAAGFGARGTGFAERMPSADDLAEGELVMVDTANAGGVIRAVKDEAHPAFLMTGVTAAQPAYLAGIEEVGKFPITVSGRAKVKVTTAVKGAIHIGDVITVSDTAGVGERTEEAGYIIGVALESYTAIEPGLITVFVRPGWFNGKTVVASSTTDGGISTDVTTSVNFKGQALIGVLALDSLDGLWSIDGTGKLTAKEVVADKVTTKDVTVEVNDNQQAAGAATLYMGNGSVRVENALVQPNSRIFVTFLGPLQGTWWVSARESGAFTLSFSERQTGDLNFEYLIVSVDDKRTPPSAPIVADTATDTDTDTDTDDASAVTEPTDAAPETTPEATETTTTNTESVTNGADADDVAAATSSETTDAGTTAAEEAPTETPAP